MSAPGPAALTVLRGNPTPEELASLLVVFAALRGGAPQPAGRAGGARRRWGGPAGWKHPHTAVEADPAIWQRTTHAPTHERTGR